MTRVAILPVSTEKGDVTYCAVAGELHSQGRTAGEALDALTALLSKDETGTLVIVQSFHPDEFFDSSRQRRLAELMGRWRVTRKRGDALPAEQQAELEALVNAELTASADRIGTKGELPFVS